MLGSFADSLLLLFTCLCRKATSRFAKAGVQPVRIRWHQAQRAVTIGASHLTDLIGPGCNLRGTSSMSEPEGEVSDNRVADVPEQIRKIRVPALLRGLLLLTTIVGVLLGLKFNRLGKSELEFRELAERSASNAQISAASHLIDNSPSDAEQMLFQTPLRFRDLAWGVLRHRRTKHALQFNGHRDLIGRLAFSPDESLLASVDLSGTIKLWDTKSGEELQTLWDPIYELSARDEWDSDDPDKVAPRRKGSFAPVSPLRYSENGRFLSVLLRPASGDVLLQLPATLFLFDLQTKTLARQIEDVIAYDFSPVESIIAIGSRGKITLSWLETSKELSLPVPEEFGSTVDLGFRGDGKSLAAISASGKLLVATAEADSWVSKINGQISGLENLTFCLSPDATQLAAIGTRTSEATQGEVPSEPRGCSRLRGGRGSTRAAILWAEKGSGTNSPKARRVLRTIRS